MALVPVLVALLVSALVVIAALVVLTGAGSRRRGAGWPATIVSGLLFPLAWVVWYARDERPLAHYRGR